MLHKLIAAVTLALLLCRPGARRRAGARHRALWRAEAAAGLHAFLLRQSGRAEGRPPRARRLRLLRQPQSAHHQRRRRQRHPRFYHREPDGARARRAVHALWPHRRDASRCPRTARRSPSISIPRRTSPTASRSPPTTCIFSLAAAEGERAPQPPHVLRQGRQGRAAVGSQPCASRSMRPATARSR